MLYEKESKVFIANVFQATVFLQLFCLVFITLELNAQLLESMTTSFHILNFYDSILYKMLEISNRNETCYNAEPF